MLVSIAVRPIVSLSCGLPRVLLLFLLLAGCQDKKEIAIFYAASLTQAFSEMSEQFRKSHPGQRIRAEISGSQIAARKVSELGLRADIVAVADHNVIDQLLIPDHADWNLLFASNELVLAHRDHSRHTETITSTNWPEILVRKGVRIGCVDPDLAPIGYRSQIAWRLAERHFQKPDLSETLTEHCAKEHEMPDESQLLALLSARAIDYAFLYRSTAEKHHLKITALPPECHLGSFAHRKTYAGVSVQVRMDRTHPVSIAGEPILYGLTIPRSARNPEGARRFLSFLLDQRGQRVLKRSGFSPQYPPIPTGNHESLSPILEPLTRTATRAP